MRVYNIIQNIILAIVAIVIAVVVASFFIFNIYPVVIVSGSMEPEIPTGAVAFIDHDERAPAIGDVIAYDLGENTVTHRVINENDGNYITKGDNNDTIDLAPVTKEQVVGTVVGSVPFAGYIIMKLKTPMGIFLVAACVLLFMLIGHILKKD